MWQHYVKNWAGFSVQRVDNFLLVPWKVGSYRIQTFTVLQLGGMPDTSLLPLVPKHRFEFPSGSKGDESQSGEQTQLSWPQSKKEPCPSPPASTECKQKMRSGLCDVVCHIQLPGAPFRVRRENGACWKWCAGNIHKPPALQPYIVLSCINSVKGNSF